MVIGLEEGTPNEMEPRGRTNSKLDAKLDASTNTLQEILKELIATKEVSSEKKEEREERKCREKENAVKNFFELQKKYRELMSPMPGQEPRKWRSIKKRKR